MPLVLLVLLLDALRRMSLREARAEDDGRRRDVVVLRVVLDSMMMIISFSCC